MAIIKTEKEKKIARESGRRLATVLYQVMERAAPGVTSRELDQYAKGLIKEGGDEPAFLGYKPSGAKIPFPASLCVSINDEVVHGIPDDHVLKEGDIVGLDLGLKHKGFITDMARTISVGVVDKNAQKLIEVTQKALSEGIKSIHVGGHVGDIGSVIEKTVKKGGFKIVEELGGHGVGAKVHEEPYIPNYGKKGTGPELVEGMVLALEPIVNEGDSRIFLEKDYYTFKTKDGKRSAHFEDTILITKNGAEIITKS